MKRIPSPLNSYLNQILRQDQNFPYFVRHNEKDRLFASQQESRVFPRNAISLCGTERALNPVRYLQITANDEGGRQEKGERRVDGRIPQSARTGSEVRSACTQSGNVFVRSHLQERRDAEDGAEYPSRTQAHDDLKITLIIGESVDNYNYEILKF